MGKKKKTEKVVAPAGEKKPSALDDLFDDDVKQQEPPKPEPKKEEPVKKEEVKKEEQVKKEEVKKEIKKKEEPKVEKVVEEKTVEKVEEVKKAEGKKEEDGEEEEEEEEEKGSGEPKKVHYCPHCKFPIEMCEFSNSFEEKCVPELRQNHPDLLKKLQELHESDALKEKKYKETKKKDSAAAEAVDKLVIHLVQRAGNQKKHYTRIVGIDLFLTAVTGTKVEIDAISSELKKKYSVGVATKEDDDDAGENEILLQGDYAKDIVEYLAEKYKVPKEKMEVKESRQKGKKMSERGGGKGKHRGKTHKSGFAFGDSSFGGDE